MGVNKTIGGLSVLSSANIKGCYSLPVWDSDAQTTKSACISDLVSAGGNIFTAGSGANSSVRCGANNTASSTFSSVLGGCSNIASGAFSSIVAGANNCVTGSCVNNSILSGAINTISNYANYSTILGGCCNTISGSYLGYDFGSSIIAGACNTIDGSNNVIINGCCNVATGDFAIIGAGSGNTITYNDQTCVVVLAGSNNSGTYAVIRGDNNAGGTHIAGSCNTGNLGIVLGSNNVGSLGGYGLVSSCNCFSCSIGGIVCSSPMVLYGRLNCLSAGSCPNQTSFIIGGTSNVLFDNCSSIINGDNNNIRVASNPSNNGFRNSIMNGDGNYICSQNRYVSIQNAVSSCIGSASNFAKIQGGCSNVIGNSTPFATIINGLNNCARTAPYASIMNGIFNKIEGGQSSCHNAIIGGIGNCIAGRISAFGNILGGLSNCITTSCHSTILGGACNVGLHDYAGIYGCGITSRMGCAFHTNQIVVTNMPTSSAGLPSGALWNNLGVVSIVP